MICIAPSLFAADPLRLADEAESIRASGSDMLHFDILDGHFAPNLSFGVNTLAALKGYPLPIDVHLIMDNPEKYIEECARAGADTITVHAEATPHLHRLLQTIRQAGAKAGVAINPATPISVLDYIMEDIDNVLIMGINPGCTMQSLIPSTLGKVREVRAKINAAKLPITIEVDGGMDPSSCLPYIQAGVDIIVLGRSFFNSADRRQLIADLHAMC